MNQTAINRLLKIEKAATAYYKAWDKLCENPVKGHGAAVNKTWHDLRKLVSPKSKGSTNGVGSSRLFG